MSYSTNLSDCQLLDILFYYTVDLPATFDPALAQLNPAFDNVVTLVHDEATDRNYFKIPREHLSLIGSDPRKYHFNYTYQIPINPETPENNKRVVDVFVTVVYPTPKFEFSGLHRSEFDSVKEENNYTNTLTIATADLLESDLGVTYKLKRFKMYNVVSEENPEGKIHPYFEESVLSMVYEKVKIDEDGDDSPENYKYQWRVKVGDADDSENANGWQTLKMDEPFTLKDRLSYDIAESYDWYAFCYNVVSDINGPLFYAPMYSGSTTAAFPTHSLDDVLDDIDHSLDLPTAANVAITNNAGNDALDLYMVNGSYTDLDEMGRLPIGLENRTNTVHGVIGVNVGSEVNTYGTLPVNLQTYSVIATSKNLCKTTPKFMGERGRYFTYELDLRLGEENENVMAECIGFRVWHDLPEDDRVEEYPGYMNHFSDNCFFDNVGDNGELTLSGVGSEYFDFVDNNGVSHKFKAASFASSNETPTLDVRVRAYYRITNGEGPSNVNALADAPEDNTPDDPANSARYIIAEHNPRIDFSKANTQVVTGVDEIVVGTQPSVRYVDLYGRISNNPFPGAVLKLITNPDGSITKQIIN